MIASKIEKYFLLQFQILLILFLLVLSKADIHGQEPLGSFPVKPILNALKIKDGIIKVNGQLSEDIWMTSDSTKVFYQVEPNQGNHAELQTTVKVLYDSLFLYIGAYCYDNLGKDGIRVQNFKRDFELLNNDCFGISIDLFNDNRNCVSFVTTPYGTQLDLQVLDGQIFNESWDAIWIVKTHITSIGWTAEIAIPWKTLKYKNGAEEFGINFFRNARRKNEFSSWALFPRVYNPFRMEFSGSLKNLKVPVTNYDIRLNPYSLTKFSNVNSDKSSRTFNLGTEFKWAVKSNLVIDATLNSDFAQADADRQIINLNRFSILFPERRQFFLDNAGIFTVGTTDWIQPFFSRTIGLNSEGTPIPINAGVRVIHQNPKQNIGGLFVRTKKQNNNPASNYLVGRYSNNISNRGRIGGLLTMRLDEDSLSTLNSVAAIDGFFRFSDAFSWKSLTSFSHTTLLCNPLSKSITSSSFNSSLNFRNNKININWNEVYINPDYQNSAGFIAWRDLLATEINVDLFLRPKWKPGFIRDFEPALYFNGYHNASDLRLKEMFITIWPIYILFQNGSILDAKIIPTKVRLTESFNPVNAINVSPGTYQFSRYEFRYIPDESKKFGLGIKGTTGNYYKGKLNSISTTLSLRPDPRLNVAIKFERNWLQKVDGHTSLVTTNLINTEARFAFSPNIQLVTLYQYNSESGYSGVNFRFAWQYRPLSFLYIVFNTIKNKLNMTERQHEGIIKINYVYKL